MSEFHYVRIPGEQGGVDTSDGPAIGLDMASMIQDGLPPWRITLEFLANLCEILDIAEQDEQIHGGIEPSFAFFDETGAVSVEGFGGAHQVLAPEGTASIAADRYGLGSLAFHLLTGRTLPAVSGDHPDDHDDAIIDAILTVEFEGLPEEMVGDMQWYLAKLLSYDPDERPSALDTWRTLVAFSSAVSGPELKAWCDVALDGQGERRGESVDGVGESMDGPVKRSGPLATGAFSFGDSAAGGSATAFWTKSEMKKALADEGDQDTFRPAVGGGAATGFWSKDQLDAMTLNAESAPRPQRSAGKAADRGSSQAPDGKRRVRTTAIQLSDIQGEEPIARPKQAPISKSVPVAMATPMAQATSKPTPAAKPTESTGSGMVGFAVGAVGALMVLLCLGVVGLGAAYYFLNQPVEEDATPSTIAPAQPEKPEEKPKTEDTGEAPEPEKPKPSAKPKPAPKPKPKPVSTTPKPKPKPKPRPKPAPAVDPNAPAKVSFSSSGRGQLTCGAMNKTFDGAYLFEVAGYELPATCLVQIDGKRGVFQVYKGGSIKCDVSGSLVKCDKSAIR